MIYDFTGGIPRKINSLCDRLFLMGYLEEFHAFGVAEVSQVITDIRQEFELPKGEEIIQRADASDELKELASINLENVHRLGKMERSIVSVIDALRKMLPATKVNNTSEDEK